MAWIPLRRRRRLRAGGPSWLSVTDALLWWRSATGCWRWLPGSAGPFERSMRPSQYRGRAIAAMRTGARGVARGAGPGSSRGHH
jgi:hypothetical protein